MFEYSLPSWFIPLSIFSLVYSSSIYLKFRMSKSPLSRQCTICCSEFSTRIHLNYILTKRNSIKLTVTGISSLLLFRFVLFINIYLLFLWIISGLSSLSLLTLYSQKLKKYPEMEKMAFLCRYSSKWIKIGEKMEKKNKNDYLVLFIDH